MALIFLRTLIVYVLIIFAMRLMGKKQLGELQPSELVSTILISNLASLSIESPELPVLSCLAPVFVIVAFEILLSALCVKSRRAERLISGSPRIVIQNGQIDQNQLADLRFTIDDLLEALRGHGVFSPEEVELAVVETNGTISIKNRDSNKKGTKHIAPPLPIIINGSYVKEGLLRCGVNCEWAQEQCHKHHCPIEQVYLMLCDGEQKTTLIRKENA